MERTYKKIIGLSVVAMTLIGSSAYAGKIITDADLSDIVVEENKQFGFGGWNFDNVDVRIVNIADFGTALEGTSFNTTDGTYSEMFADQSFESEIKSATGEVMGHLHGKDWPVGEPAGIKIINDDSKVKEPKPMNCIMTSSYLEYQDVDDNTSGSGYLDAWAEGNTPNPVLCSSGWQTHKRYKINLLPSTVAEIDAEGFGKPVDLVFNLDMDDNDTVARKYQVLQKVNNYTDKRLDGYKIEVLDVNGLPNDALTLSLGVGEGLVDPETNVTGDIWAENELANYSHGLWGPYQEVGGEVRFENGFFDWIRSHYPATLSEDNKTISYVGDMQGGNYQAIFGNWLPSIWAPMGIFHDDDDNPATDGVLKTFFGVAPGETDLAWWTRSVVDVDPNDNIDPVYTWAKATEAELTLWEGELYSEDHVEDVLNLGLNYIINVGENAQIGSTFTLRLTPHVAADQTPPSSYAPDYMDPRFSAEATADFNGDNIVDIAWRDLASGKLDIWFMNSDGSHTTKSSAPGVNYDLSAAADLNGDGNADIAWRDPATGKLVIWFMQSDTTLTYKVYRTGSNYNLDATADFNGDGIADIAWRDPATGKFVLWFMDNTGTRTYKVYTTGRNYNLDATDDLNGDGNVDIAWRDPATGKFVIWFMQSDGTRTYKVYTTGRNYNLDATADFNGDGIADIAWRDPATGTFVLWFMDNAGTRTYEVYTTGTNYTLEATGDFNGDSIADIAWRDATAGTLVIWSMDNAGGYTEQEYLMDSAYTLDAAKNFNGDTTDDILWRNSSNGDNIFWYMPSVI